MLFITFATLATSLSISINGKEFTADTFDDVLSNYGSGKSTIQSLIVNSGQFPLSSITTDFSQLSILHVPRESYVGEVPKVFLRKLTSLTDVQIDGATVINSQAFQFCSGLRTISFPLCEKIYEYAFEYCTSLQDVTFKSCTDLGNYAFGYCSALSSINFPILNILGYYSFIQTALTSIELDTVTKVNSYNTGSRQFSECTKLTYVSMKSLTSLASYMFVGCTKLSSYDFPSVTEISTSTFRNCPSITSLNFPSLTKIGSYAFYGSNNFVKVDLPHVVQVGEKAFYKCVGIREVSFKSCTELENSVFADCSALASINFPALNTLGSQAFVNTALKEIELDTVTKFNGNAQFSQCSKLTYISLKGATILTNSMFDGCTQLSSYDFSSVIEIDNFAFKNCKSITTLSFPSLATIGEYAFSRLNGIEEVDLPTVVTIKDYAFQYCLNLKSVSLLSCTTIYSYAFQYCSSLSSVNIPNLEELKSFVFRSTAITKAQFDSVSILNTYIFSGCSKLAQVSMKSANTITKGMFEKCYQLRIVDIPLCKKIDQYGFNGCTNIGTLTIGYQTVNFEGIPAPSYLQKITFPYALSIENYALSGLSNLVYCNFPKVNVINSNTFEGLSRLVELEIPSVTELKENAFTGCVSLSSISLKSLLIVDSTSTNIFKGCQNLKTLYLPDNPPKTFQKDTFKGMNCKVVIPLDAVSVYDNDVSITGDKANDGFWCGIPLPSEILTIKINNQKETVSGQQLSECIQISGVSESLITSLEIVSGMIKLSTMIDSVNNLPALKDFIISDSVIIEDTFTEGMFNKSPFLSLTIDTSIEKVPKNCFLDCSRIQKVKITKCKEIQDSAFKGCINLISVIINAETLSGDSHFEGCQSLTSVSLTHLKKVDPSASKIFLNCPLNSLYFPSTPPSTFHPNTFNGRRILFFGLSSTELKNYDSNIEVAGDVANDYKWCGIDLFQIYVEVSFNGQRSVKSDSIQNAMNLAGVSYVQSINIIRGYVTSTILNEIKGINYLNNLKISDTAALESYIIGPEQFKNHANLEYIEIMHDVSLSENCFMGCTSLIKAEFGSAKLLGEGCFKDCESLTSLIIPQCQELKGDYIFANCKKLTTIDLSSLLYVNNESENIFSGCINLEKIILPSIEPTSFNKNSFKDCKELILVLPYSNDYIKYDDNSKVEDDVAEDDKWCGISFDPEKANQKMLHFKINDVEYKRRSFKNLPIKGSLSTLNLLEDEIELKSLELISGSFEPNDLKKITSGSTTLEKFIAHEDTLKSILEMTFDDCSSLKEITILSDFDIEQNVFQNLPALTTLTIPMLKVVHSNEFKGDINLQNISLPLVSSIPKGLFASFEKLYAVDLPSVTILNDNCFSNCASLQRINLPSVKKIFGDSHFSGCKNLELVFLPSLETVNPEGSLIFENCNNFINLTLPNEPPSIFHKEIFKNAGTTPNIHLIDESGWKNYYKQCTIDPDTENYNWYGFNLNIKREDNEVNNKDAPSKKGHSTGTLVGAIIGTVIGSIAICIIIMLVIKKCKPGAKAPIENEP